MGAALARPPAAPRGADAGGLLPGWSGTPAFDADGVPVGLVVVVPRLTAA